MVCGSETIAAAVVEFIGLARMGVTKFSNIASDAMVARWIFLILCKAKPSFIGRIFFVTDQAINRTSQY